MIKKTGLCTRALKMKYIICVIVVGLFYRVNFAEDLFARICTYFVSCDSILEEIGNDVANIASLPVSEKLLLDKINAHPEFELFLRTNSKGVIISRVTQNRIEPKRYKNVSDQSWYKIIGMNRKAYYGNLMNKNGSYLFWCKPLFTKTTSGYRFSGTLAAKIDLSRLFAVCAAQNDEKFQIVFRNTMIYSNLKQKAAGGLVSKRLPVYGFPGITLMYTGGDKTNESTFSIGDSIQNRAVATLTDTLQGAASTAAAAHASEKQSGLTQETKPAAGKGTEPLKAIPRKTSAGNRLLFIVLIAVCIALVGLTFYILKKAADKNRKILEDVDKASYE